VLDLVLFKNIYEGKKVLVTGHTGFKGSWLVLWLINLGAEVTGISLDPEINKSHWNLLNLSIDDRRCDIRDANSIRKIISEKQPEIVFHLAAQPLVRQSYKDPLETWSTNVMGTANILEACRHEKSVKAILAITSDKCYENLELVEGYSEDDRLGGHDPYSASKAASELVVSSFRSAFYDERTMPLIATARAGNVVGGGDWSKDRLIPDLISSINKNGSLEIRYPNATRPWQHVLESLSGYLVLGQELMMNNRKFSGPWNFGPASSDNQTVSEVLNKFNKIWGEIHWHEAQTFQPHEASLLSLNSSKANKMLKWQSVWKIDTMVEKTCEWYKTYLKYQRVISQQQLSDYTSDAMAAKVEWAVL